MTVDAASLKKLAHLAKLAVDDAELRALVPELAAIVRHVDSLRAVDTTGVPPMRHGAPLADADVDVDGDGDGVRADVAGVDVLGRAAVAGSAGFDVDDGTVVVPKVVD